MPSRDLVFISYSHRDKKWLSRLQTFLKPFERRGQLRIWADPWVRTGDRWRRKIGDALERSHAAVLLVSPDFIASDFIYDEELPPLLEAAGRDELVLVCVPISASAYQTLPLGEYQWARDPEQPLDELRTPQRNRALVEITSKIVEIVTSSGPSATVETSRRMAFSRRESAASLHQGSGGQSLGRLHRVPAPPPHYLSRPIELERLRSSLLSGADKMIGVIGQGRSTAFQKVGLQGMGGIGKTVMAIALARDEVIRGAFADGVFWLTVGQQPDLLRLQAQIARDLGGETSDFKSSNQGLERLRGLFAGKTCLLVLDDVWDADHVEAFDVLGERSRMLITTRDAGILPMLDAKREQLGVLSEELALALLAKWSGQGRETLPAEASAVAEACGYLPLALSMVAAQVRELGA